LRRRKTRSVTCTGIRSFRIPALEVVQEDIIEREGFVVATILPAAAVRTDLI
jgi:hypothetical protein